MMAGPLFDVLVATAPPARAPVSPEHALGRCLSDLDRQLAASGRTRRDLVSLTAFVGADALGEPLRALVGDFLQVAAPPFGIVRQPAHAPAGIAVEATIAPRAPGTFVRWRRWKDIGYAVIFGPGPKTRQVHCRGIASDPAHADPAARGADALATMNDILRREELTFNHVVRQWNYIEGLLDVADNGTAEHQGYQAFNDVRTLAYERCAFPAGYPAATGIGQAAGGVVIDFVALDAGPDGAVVPLSNPRQTDAHHYSPRMLVGEPVQAVAAKGTPKFERAKLVALGDQEIVFVSGTAAILGERSVAAGDVAAQTELTIDNIAALVGGRCLSHLRAYVKHARDIPVVRRICGAAFGPIPALYVQADVCRDELLVELEGALVRRAGRHIVRDA